MGLETGAIKLIEFKIGDEVTRQNLVHFIFFALSLTWSDPEYLGFLLSYYTIDQPEMLEPDGILKRTLREKTFTDEERGYIYDRFLRTHGQDGGIPVRLDPRNDPQYEVLDGIASVFGCAFKNVRTEKVYNKTLNDVVDHIRDAQSRGRETSDTAGVGSY